MKNNLPEKRIKNGKTELLAPAGTPAHLRAAVNSGADAVYVGGKRFSARAGAGNFDDDEMKWAADYCRLRNVKLYVTVNTLIFDDEMEDAVEYAKYLYEIGIDALIVQDLGFASAVRMIMPDFPLHLSTQGTVYSKEGVLAAERIGFERIVLAREVSLSDMHSIMKMIEENGIDTELEVFVHGALCFCFSGQCQMSRMRGGRSGNRGACAQPCRLSYIDLGGKEPVYKLSPKDLCSVDSLGELIDCGIASLKIEGRMKSPEYVATVVSVYRKYIDLYMRDGFYIVSEDDRRILNQIFNRGGFTDGYLHENPKEKLMTGDVPKHRGVKIGRVVRRISESSAGRADGISAKKTRGRGGFGKGDLIEVIIDDGESLSMGDGVEIRNDEMPGNVVTYIKEIGSRSGNEKRAGAGRETHEAKGKRLVIGDIRGRVSEGDEIYKITDKTLMEKAALAYTLDRDGNELTVRKSGVSMKFTAHIGEHAVLTVCECGEDCGVRDSRPRGFAEVSVNSESTVEEAVNKPVTAERLRQQLAKTGGSVFFAEDITVETDENISIPMSAVNAMRREALELLAEKKTEAGRRALTAGEEEKMHSFEKDGKGACADSKIAWIYVNAVRSETEDEIRKALEFLAEEGKSENANAGAQKQNLQVRICLPLKDHMENTDAIKEIISGICADADIAGEFKVSVVPYISNVSMGKEDEYVRENFSEIVRAVKESGSGIICGNIGWLSAFAGAGAGVTAGFGLNSANTYTEKLLKAMGAGAVMPSAELAAADENNIQASRSTYKIKGAVPLMTSEHILPEGTFAAKNRLQGNERYISMTNTYGDKSLVLKNSTFKTVMIIFP